QYNRAFNYYIKADNYKNSITLRDSFITKKEENNIESYVKIIVVNLTKKIKETILDLGTKFTRLEIREIAEKCEVDNENLITIVAKDMINNKEIYAEYFSSSNSVSFNQQANIEEIDTLMDIYKEWEKGLNKKS
ncbi:unnamed protein product, partial [marine sediment metagenome]